MGRKRGFGCADTSDDDDFRPSGAESASPNFSRLKRKRRTSRRERPGSQLSPVADSHQADDDGVYICIPDSAHDKEHVVSETPEPSPSRDVKNEAVFAFDAEEREEGGDDAAQNEFSAVADAGKVGKTKEGEPRASTDGAMSRASDEEGEERKTEPEAETLPARTPRRAAAVNRSSFDESDSGSEPDHSEEEGEPYDSQEDEPDEDGSESDFEPSPKKPQPKKKKVPAKNTATAPKTRGKQLLSPAAKNAASKPSKNTVKHSSMIPSRRAPLSNFSNRVRTLSSRIPCKTSVLARQNNDVGQRKTTSSERRHAVVRAGLSRKAAIPRLHSYLHK